MSKGDVDALEAIGGFTIVLACILSVAAVLFAGARLLGFSATWTWWEIIVLGLLMAAYFSAAVYNAAKLQELRAASDHLAAVEKRLAGIAKHLESIDRKT
jgi:hypothetical protein